MKFNKIAFVATDVPEAQEALKRLTERYGDRVNLAAFLAEKELDDVIRLTVGALVDFVVSKLADTTVA